MNVCVSPLWWPVLAASSPLTVPLLLVRNRSFRKDCVRAAASNRERIARARPLALPPLDALELTVLVDWRAEPGFVGDAGVSYLLRTELGTVLFGVGFGAAGPALTRMQAELAAESEVFRAGATYRF